MTRPEQRCLQRCRQDSRRKRRQSLHPRIQLSWLCQSLLLTRQPLLSRLLSWLARAWNKEVIWNGHGYRQSHWVRLTVTVCILFCVQWESAWVL
jgi:hypothetical protein